MFWWADVTYRYLFIPIVTMISLLLIFYFDFEILYYSFVTFITLDFFTYILLTHYQRFICYFVTLIHSLLFPFRHGINPLSLISFWYSFFSINTVSRRRIRSVNSIDFNLSFEFLWCALYSQLSLPLVTVVTQTSHIFDRPQV
jgi:hypothetical protein